MKKLILAPVLALTLAGNVLVGPASAHSPSGGATCDGVFAQGTGYDTGDTNTLTVTIDGVSESMVFGADGYLEGDVPQDGVEHTWSWSVDTTNPDPAYDASDSGTITCGTPPPPVEPKTKHAWFRVVAYCTTVHVEGRHNVARIVHRHPRPGRHVFIAHAKPGAVFGNGHHVKRKVAHVKRGCHQGS